MWGEKQFNSTFPAALCCYMKDKNLDAVLLSVDNAKVKSSVLPISKLFNSTRSCANLYFSFESRFDSYKSVINDTSLERVDLVVSEAEKNEDGAIIQGKQLRPLEVKLTVVPDNSTAEDDESNWAPEIVIRPATTKYCAMGMALNCSDKRKEIRKIFESKLSSVSGWGNQTEARTILPTAIKCLEEFESKFSSREVPLVMQPIWKTQGKSPLLAEHAFDIFVWTDFALARLIIDQAKKSVGRPKVSRPARSALRLARFLYEYGRAGKAPIANIYDEMTYGYQSDKDFAVSGKVTATYMKHKRRHSPKLHRSTATKVILGGGAKRLSPERRFDQSIYFSYGYEAE